MQTVGATLRNCAYITALGSRGILCIPELPRGLCMLRSTLALLLICAGPAVATASTESSRRINPTPCASSVVFEDRNGDGRRHPSEPPLPDILVSDGESIVRTDAHGRFQLPAVSGARTVFVIKPAGYAFARRADGLPDMWRDLHVTSGPAAKDGGLPAGSACHDIGLCRETRSMRQRDALRVLLFGDPQPKSALEVDYYARDIVEPIIRPNPGGSNPTRSNPGRSNPARSNPAESNLGGSNLAGSNPTESKVAGANATEAGVINTAASAAADSASTRAVGTHRGRAIADLGLTLGDIVDDDLSLYPAMNAVTAKLGLPWLHVAGNHDIDVDASSDEDSLVTFRHYYGSDTLAWEEFEANFVVLDDVIYLPGRKPGYIGGLRESQFTFLQGYLAQADRSRLLVLALHIPLFEENDRDTFRDADRKRLFALLRDFPHVLVLSAHRHNQQHVYHDARSGWHGVNPLHEYNVGASGGAFWSGQKDATGIPVTTMSDGTPNGYALLDISSQGSYRLLWQTARGQGGDGIGIHAPRVLRRGAYPGFGVYANVYMGRDDTRVEYRVAGGHWQPMRKVLAPDPALLAENVLDDAALALRGYDRSPEARPSTHLWRGVLPTDLPPGEHAVDVRAIDRWWGEQRVSTSYRLQDASP